MPPISRPGTTEALPRMSIFWSDSAASCMKDWISASAVSMADPAASAQSGQGLVVNGRDQKRKRSRSFCGATCSEALADCCSGVAQSVECVGALPHYLRDQASDFPLVRRCQHLRQAAGVVGDRAVGVGGEGDAEGGEHADSGERDAVRASQPHGCVDRHAGHNHRGTGGLRVQGQSKQRSVPHRKVAAGRPGQEGRAEQSMGSVRPAGPGRSLQ